MVYFSKDFAFYNNLLGINLGHDIDSPIIDIEADQVITDSQITNEHIKGILDHLSSNIGLENLIIAKHNLKTLKIYAIDIEQKKAEEDLSIQQNAYFYNENALIFTKLFLYDEKEEKIYNKNASINLIHELMHAFSTFNKNSKTWCGFSRIENDIADKSIILKSSIGIAFNEGYTQTLTEILWDIENDRSYCYEKNVVAMIREVANKSTLDKSYFRADLLGLIKELKKYHKTSSILKFLNAMDIILTIKSTEECKEEYKDILIKCHKYISNFLEICFIKNNNNNFDEMIKKCYDEFANVYFISASKKKRVI